MTSSVVSARTALSAEDEAVFEPVNRSLRPVQIRDGTREDKIENAPIPDQKYGIFRM